jgi:hypothetical protein
MAATIKNMVFGIVLLPLPLPISLILPPASVDFLLGLLFDLEDGDVLKCLSVNYKASHP